MLDHIPTYAGDPILSLMDDYQKDPRAHKVNLSIGLYYNEQQVVPQFQAVQRAYADLADQLQQVKLYLPMSGLVKFNTACKQVIFGEQSEYNQARISTVQSLGGSGALKLAADFIHTFFPHSALWVSNPTWDNHLSIFSAAGVNCHHYPYYDPHSKGLDFAAMLTTLTQLPAQSVVLLHPCCHNPTGVDLNTSQWDQVIALCKKNQLIALFDIAYQGFSQDLQQDNYAIKAALKADLTFMVSHSCSKIFSLYGERVGSLSVVCPDAISCARVEGQLKSLVRKIYSSPPTTGALVVSHILTTPDLNLMWQQELAQIRERMQLMRQGLKLCLEQLLPQQHFSYLTQQNGMFSYTGLSTTQVQQLRDQFGIYLVGSGRLCIAGLNQYNLEYMAHSLARVMDNSEQKTA